MYACFQRGGLKWFPNELIIGRYMAEPHIVDGEAVGDEDSQRHFCNKERRQDKGHYYHWSSAGMVAKWERLPILTTRSPLQLHYYSDP